MRTTEDILAPPTDADVERALALFADAAAAAYGGALAALYRFGSRMRRLVALMDGLLSAVAALIEIGEAR